MATQPIEVERVYGQPDPKEGLRVLVDRLWPRGVRKDALRYDEWAKDLAPSTQLRKWYGHDVTEFDEFRSRYLAELDTPEGHKAVQRVLGQAQHRPIVLLTATKDVEHSAAAVLRQLLEQSR